MIVKVATFFVKPCTICAIKDSGVTIDYPVDRWYASAPKSFPYGRDILLLQSRRSIMRNSFCTSGRPEVMPHAISLRNTEIMLLVSVFLVLLAGCGGGPKLYKVKGTVNVDGKPAGGVNLTFYNQDGGGSPSSAQSQPDGSFAPSTVWENNVLEGIPAGKYSVSAVYPDPNPKKAPSAGLMRGSVSDPPDLLKGNYAVPSPELTIEIESDASAPVIELSTKVKKK